MNTLMGPLTFDDAKPEAGLRKSLELEPDDVLELMTESNLKGRGGAGFPTGAKWRLAAGADDEDKYVVCNADEGEPGTFKDRVLLAEYLDLVVEGMTIGAWAIGARHGVIYLRGEYSYLRSHLEAVLKRRREDNLLGCNIMGRLDFDFDVEVMMGAGAYVCGEETALIESMEGQRGEPRSRPPYPVTKGYLGHPTIINNVETFAWAACIIDRGAEWFREHGTQHSSGLKIFSVSGDCARPGVYEFPLGVTVEDVLREVGAPEAKAVQIGGAAGFTLPRSQFGRQIAYEDVPTGGSIIIFGKDRDMLKVAKNFLEFFADESCGQCTPCREGNRKLLEGIEMLERGECSMHYLRELCALGETMRLASKCGLGQTSPNPFLNTVEFFKDELIGRIDKTETD
ncbi:dehydrogenase [Candidatus Sumerlaeota bacterium]|nr:dehydrogenase [Candidatus Sumerlaeota bacterium]